MADSSLSKETYPVTVFDHNLQTESEHWITENVTKKWTDNPLGVSPEYPYEFCCTRLYTFLDNIADKTLKGWNSWDINNIALWSHYGKNASPNSLQLENPYESIYYYYKESTKLGYVILDAQGATTGKITLYGGYETSDKDYELKIDEIAIVDDEGVEHKLGTTSDFQTINDDWTCRYQLKNKEGKPVINLVGIGKYPENPIQNPLEITISANDKCFDCYINDKYLKKIIIKATNYEKNITGYTTWIISAIKDKNNNGIYRYRIVPSATKIVKYATFKKLEDNSYKELNSYWTPKNNIKYDVEQDTFGSTWENIHNKKCQVVIKDTDTNNILFIKELNSGNIINFPESELLNWWAEKIKSTPTLPQSKECIVELQVVDPDYDKNYNPESSEEYSIYSVVDTCFLTFEYNVTIEGKDGAKGENGGDGEEGSSGYTITVINDMVLLDDDTISNEAVQAVSSGKIEIYGDEKIEEGIVFKPSEGNLPNGLTLNLETNGNFNLESNKTSGTWTRGFYTKNIEIELNSKKIGTATIAVKIANFSAGETYKVLVVPNSMLFKPDGSRTDTGLSITSYKIDGKSYEKIQPTLINNLDDTLSSDLDAEGNYTKYLVIKKRNASGNSNILKAEDIIIWNDTTKSYELKKDAAIEYNESGYDIELVIGDYLAMDMEHIDCPTSGSSNSLILDNDNVFIDNDCSSLEDLFILSLTKLNLYQDGLSVDISGYPVENSDTDKENYINAKTELIFSNINKGVYVKSFICSKDSNYYGYLAFCNSEGIQYKNNYFSSNEYTSKSGTVSDVPCPLLEQGLLPNGSYSINYTITSTNIPYSRKQNVRVKELGKASGYKLVCIPNSINFNAEGTGIVETNGNIIKPIFLIINNGILTANITLVKNPADIDDSGFFCLIDPKKDGYDLNNISIENDSFVISASNGYIPGGYDIQIFLGGAYNPGSEELDLEKLYDCEHIDCVKDGLLGKAGASGFAISSDNDRLLLDDNTIPSTTNKIGGTLTSWQASDKLTENISYSLDLTNEDLFNLPKAIGKNVYVIPILNSTTGEFYLTVGEIDKSNGIEFKENTSLFTTSDRWATGSAYYFDIIAIYNENITFQKRIYINVANFSLGETYNLIVTPNLYSYTLTNDGKTIIADQDNLSVKVVKISSDGIEDVDFNIYYDIEELTDGELYVKLCDNTVSYNLTKEENKTASFSSSSLGYRTNGYRVELYIGGVLNNLPIDTEYITCLYNGKDGTVENVEDAVKDALKEYVYKGSGSFVVNPKASGGPTATFKYSSNASGYYIITLKNARYNSGGDICFKSSSLEANTEVSLTMDSNFMRSTTENRGTLEGSNLTGPYTPELYDNTIENTNIAWIKCTTIEIEIYNSSNEVIFKDTVIRTGLDGYYWNVNEAGLVSLQSNGDSMTSINLTASSLVSIASGVSPNLCKAAATNNTSKISICKNGENSDYPYDAEFETPITSKTVLATYDGKKIATADCEISVKYSGSTKEGYLFKSQKLEYDLEEQVIITEITDESKSYTSTVGTNDDYVTWNKIYYRTYSNILVENGVFLENTTNIGPTKNDTVIKKCILLPIVTDNYPLGENLYAFKPESSLYGIQYQSELTVGQKYMISFYAKGSGLVNLKIGTATSLSFDLTDSYLRFSTLITAEGNDVIYIYGADYISSILIEKGTFLTNWKNYGADISSFILEASSITQRVEDIEKNTKATVKVSGTSIVAKVEGEDHPTGLTITKEGSTFNGKVSADSFLVNSGGAVTLNDDDLNDGVMWLTTYGCIQDLLLGDGSNLGGKTIQNLPEYCENDTPLIIMKGTSDFFVLNPLQLSEGGTTIIKETKFKNTRSLFVKENGQTGIQNSILTIDYSLCSELSSWLKEGYDIIKETIQLTGKEDKIRYYVQDSSGNIINESITEFYIIKLTGACIIPIPVAIKNNVYEFTDSPSGPVKNEWPTLYTYDLLYLAPDTYLDDREVESSVNINMYEKSIIEITKIEMECEDDTTPSPYYDYYKLKRIYLAPVISPMKNRCNEINFLLTGSYGVYNTSYKGPAEEYPLNPGYVLKGILGSSSSWDTILVGSSVNGTQSDGDFRMTVLQLTKDKMHRTTPFCATEDNSDYISKYKTEGTGTYIKNSIIALAFKNSTFVYDSSDPNSNESDSKLLQSYPPSYSKELETGTYNTVEIDTTNSTYIDDNGKIVWSKYKLN